MVQGADKMNDNEHLLNVYVAKNAAGSCADFLGYTVVQSSADVSDRRITPGKWLVRTRARLSVLPPRTISCCRYLYVRGAPALGPPGSCAPHAVATEGTFVRRRPVPTQSSV